MRMRTPGGFGRYRAAQEASEAESLRAFAVFLADLFASIAPHAANGPDMAWEIHARLLEVLTADQRAALSSLGLIARLS
jgi:hypothetical protein